MRQFKELQKLQVLVQQCVKELDPESLNEISKVLICKNDPIMVEEEIFDFFLESRKTVNKDEQVLSLQQDKFLKSQQLVNICRKLNASISIEPVKNEKPEIQAEVNGEGSNIQHIPQILSNGVKKVKPNEQTTFSIVLNEDSQSSQLKKPPQLTPELVSSLQKYQQSLHQKKMFEQINNQRIQQNTITRPTKQDNGQQQTKEVKFTDLLKQFLSTIKFYPEQPILSNNQQKLEKQKERLFKEKQFQDRGISSKITDFASFKYLCLLKSQLHQTDLFSDHLASKITVNRFDSIIFKSICNPEEDTEDQKDLMEIYTAQIEKEPSKMREFKEALHRSIFLYFGPILDSEYRGWSRQTGNFNEADRVKYTQKRMDKSRQLRDFTDVQDRNQRFCWYDSLLLLTNKLKYYPYLDTFKGNKQEYKECYDILLALMLMIESPRMSEAVTEVML